jgi:plasmid stabilization system protein ParE
MMDILEQAEWYQQHSGEALAGKWENAVASAILQLSKNPDAGSSCKFRNAELADTRRIGIPQFRNTLSSIPLLVGN